MSTHKYLYVCEKMSEREVKRQKPEEERIKERNEDNKRKPGNNHQTDKPVEKIDLIK